MLQNILAGLHMPSTRYSNVNSDIHYSLINEQTLLPKITAFLFNFSYDIK